MLKNHLVFVLLMLSCCSKVTGQNIDSLYVEELVNGYVLGTDKYLWPDLISNEQLKSVILKCAKEHVTNEDFLIRNRSYSLINITGQTAKSDSLKMSALSVFVKCLKDDYAGIKRSNGEKLLKYERKYFSDEIKLEIEEMLLSQKYVDHSIILLAGMLNFYEQKDYLRNNFINQKGKHPNQYSNSYFDGLEWAAYLALARMGEMDCLDYVIETVQKEKLLDIFWYRAVDLAYVRQDKATVYLMKLLDSDYDVGTRQNEAFRILKLLTKSIDNFPVEDKHHSIYKRTDLDLGIQWMQDNFKELVYNLEAF